MPLIPETFTAPAAWASYLINGDESGLDDCEARQVDAWAATLPGPVVSCGDAETGPGFTRWHDAAAFLPLAADCLEYDVLREGCALEALEHRQDAAQDALDRHRDAVEAAANALADAGTAQEAQAEAEALAAACDAMRAAQAQEAARVAEINRQAMAEAETVALRLESIVGRLVAEGARDVTDSDLARHLGPCVCGPPLVRVAKAARYRGLLTPDTLDAMRGGPDTWAAWQAKAARMAEGVEA